MDTLSLLAAAREARVVVRFENGRLRIRSPRAAEALVRQILLRKTEIIPLLAWDELAADRLLREQIERLAHFCPREWWASETEAASIGAGEEAIDAAFVARDPTALRVALEDYAWAVFSSWRRWHNTRWQHNTDGQADETTWRNSCVKATDEQVARAVAAVVILDAGSSGSPYAADEPWASDRTRELRRRVVDPSGGHDKPQNHNGLPHQCPPRGGRK